jgi:hypothetical protein
VTVDVVAGGDAEWTLSLRVPAWARTATLDGEPVAPGDYASVTRRWHPGDRVVLEIDVSPRITAPNPRIDAVRGCVAIERGPVVYCFEEIDLPVDAALADLVVETTVEPADAGPVEQLRGVPGVEVAGAFRDGDGWAEGAYRDIRALLPAGVMSQTRPVAIPYFTWANRGANAMRIWVPAQAT